SDPWRGVRAARSAFPSEWTDENVESPDDPARPADGCRYRLQPSAPARPRSAGAAAGDRVDRLHVHAVRGPPARGRTTARAATAGALRRLGRQPIARRAEPQLAAAAGLLR